MHILFDFIAAFLFGLGLAISGMTMPEKVIGFLDIFGDWDPSLMMVMIGAIAVHAISYRLILKRPSPLFSEHFQIPSLKSIDKKLMLGSALFGFGWGLGGFCPGPAVVSLIAQQSTAIIFVASMVVGMAIFRIFEKKLQ